MKQAVTKEDREYLDKIQRLIDDPDTSPEVREELREEYGTVALGYVIAAAFEDDPSLAKPLHCTRQPGI